LNFRQEIDMHRSSLIRIILATGLVAVSSPALAQKEIPTPPEFGDVLEFTGPEEGWPPQVRGATDIRVLPIDRVLISVTPAFATRLEEIASASPLVQRSLGERFAFIDGYLAEGAKEEVAGPLEKAVVQAVFYSYSRNVAVRVLVQGGEVLEATDIEGYQPPETPGEIELAVKLARDHPDIRDLVGDLEGRALVAEPGEGESGAGHRVLYVSFVARDSALTEVMALVDLTDGVVLEARRVAER
jgi:hypothetical protein